MYHVILATWLFFQALQSVPPGWERRPDDAGHCSYGAEGNGWETIAQWHYHEDGNPRTPGVATMGVYKGRLSRPDLALAAEILADGWHFDTTPKVPPGVIGYAYHVNSAPARVGLGWYWQERGQWLGLSILSTGNLPDSARSELMTTIHKAVAGLKPALPARK